MTISLYDLVPFNEHELDANRRAAYSTAQLEHARRRIAERNPSAAHLTRDFLLQTRLGRIISIATLAMCWGVLSLWFIVVYYGEAWLIALGLVAALLGIGLVLRTFYIPIRRYTDWRNAQPALQCVEGVLRAEVNPHSDPPTWTLAVEGAADTLRIPMGPYSTPLQEIGQPVRVYVFDFGFMQALAAFEPVE